MIQTKHTHWRLIIEMDLPLIHELQSIPEVERFNTLGLPENFEQTKERMMPLILDNMTGANLTFAVLSKDKKEMMGLFAIKKFPERYNAVEVWYKYFPKYWGQGIGTECLQEFIKYGFETMKLHRIEGGCAVDHKASVRLFEKVGMQREGRGRQTLPLVDGWSDHYTYAILESDYQEWKKERS
jgi:RimJ/RimL family protein N-acetyltransferase